MVEFIIYYFAIGYIIACLLAGYELWISDHSDIEAGKILFYLGLWPIILPMALLVIIKDRFSK